MKKNLLLLTLFVLGFFTMSWANDNVKIFSPKDFQIGLQKDTAAVILDVRRPTEFAEGHIKGAINIDWLDIENFKAQAEKLDINKTYFIYCRSGKRSNAAAREMAKRGFKVFDLQGGILLWKQQGFEVVK